MLKLAKVAVGTPQKPKQWSNSEQRYVDLDPRDTFLASMTDREFNYKNKGYTQTLFERHNNIPDGHCYHQNYMMYLKKCWEEHLGIVISPDIIWQGLLCEITGIVKGDPEKFRHLFTDSPDKKDIIIVTEELVTMPLGLLTEALKELVPTDSSDFLLEFSTTNMRAKHSFSAAFADICSPYYNYSMCLCAFPCIDVRGTKDDWRLLRSSFWAIRSKLKACEGWFDKVDKILGEIIDNLGSADFWTKMFSLKKCGSGSDVEVNGWISNLYVKQPEGLNYPSNFASHISLVNYRQLDTEKDYLMKDGLFYSKMEGDVLVPEFGFVVFEKVETVFEEQDFPLQIESMEIKTKNRKLKNDWKFI